MTDSFSNCQLRADGAGGNMAVSAACSHGRVVPRGVGDVVLRIVPLFSAIVYALNRVLRRDRTDFQEEMQNERD
jgi:hypothetical protein